MKDKARHLPETAAEEIGFQHTGWPGEGPQTAGAFGAAKVAGGGGFKRNRNGHAPLNGFAQPAAELVTAENQKAVPKAERRQFADQVERIVSVQSGHPPKITGFAPLIAAGNIVRPVTVGTGFLVDAVLIAETQFVFQKSFVIRKDHIECNKIHNVGTGFGW